MDSTRPNASKKLLQLEKTSLATLLVLTAIIVSVVLVLFGRAVHFDFINYDDPAYVYDNEIVSQGLTKHGVKWGLTEVGQTNLWHPLTWWSHMADVELFGLKSAAGHHAVNVFWHIIGSLGLFFLIRRITGGTWIAFFVTAVWAFHPQRVQSVVWISERKDVLSGAFLLWSWWSWERWRGASNSSKIWYWFALLLFVFAGLSKPSVVPLPLILWFREMFRENKKLSMRKGGYWLMRVMPFAIVSAVVAGLTIYFQRIGGMSNVTEVMPLTKRLMLMPHSLWWYIQSFFYPVPGKLWVYPPASNMAGLLVPAIGLFTSFVAVVVFGLKSRLVVLGTLVFLLLWLPVSGIVPVSFYYVADRYSYLIHLGILIVLADLVSSLLRRTAITITGNVVAGLAALVVMVLLVISWGRVGYWKNSESLFTYERSVNSRSLLAPIHLGVALDERGEFKQALALFKEAMEKDKESGLAAYNAGRMLDKLGRKEEAIAMYVAAGKKKTLHYPSTFRRHALLLLEKNQVAEAEVVLQNGLKRFPENLSLMSDLGFIAANHRKDPAAAIMWYDRVLAKAPNNLQAMQGKGVALIEIGKTKEGIILLKKLVKKHPNLSNVREYLQSISPE